MINEKRGYLRMTKKQTGYPEFKGLGLNERQQEFVKIYCRPDNNYNATRAYAEAYGYDPDKEGYNTCAVEASKFLKKPNILKGIDIERERFIGKHDDIARFVLKEWMKMAQVDVTDAMDITGAVAFIKDIDDIPPHVRSCIKSIKTGANGVEVTFHEKTKALESLAKALGMFVEKTQNVNEEYESLIDKIAAKDE